MSVKGMLRNILTKILWFVKYVTFRRIPPEPIRRVRESPPRGEKYVRRYNCYFLKYGVQFY